MYKIGVEKQNACTNPKESKLLKLTIIFCLYILLYKKKQFKLVKHLRKYSVYRYLEHTTIGRYRYSI